MTPVGSRRDSPAGLGAAAWGSALARTGQEILEDHVLQWGAALTFFAVLALFPALLALVSVLGLVGASAVGPLIENATELAPGTARDVLLRALESIKAGGNEAGVALALGLGAALWSASAYVGAFIPAANVVWEVDEARPLLRKLLLRVALTLALLCLVAVSALTVVVTGPIARRLGDLIGLGSEAVDAWTYLKWPFLAAVVMTVLAILYWAAPNVRHPGWRWIVPGSVLAVMIWIAASLGFTVYVARFGAFNATYGGIGGVVVFLLWLWIANLAILVGAELNAELERARAVEGGYRASDGGPFLPLRHRRSSSRVR